MSFSKVVPQFVTAKTPKQLSSKILDIQIRQYGKVAIISMYYDPSEKVHICWYYPRTDQVITGI